MASETSTSVTKHIDALFRTGTAVGLCDSSLLDRFRTGPADQAEAAFAVLVERHASMVLYVCRRILGDRHDAEDAAQATFLVLASHARTIRRTDSVASWLYGVAARISTRARRDTARRRLRERRGAAGRWRSGSLITTIAIHRDAGPSSTRSSAGSPTGSACPSCFVISKA